MIGEPRVRVTEGLPDLGARENGNTLPRLETLRDGDGIARLVRELEIFRGRQPAAGAVPVPLMNDELGTREDALSQILGGRIQAVGCRAILRKAAGLELRPETVEHETRLLRASTLLQIVAVRLAVRRRPRQSQYVVVELASNRSGLLVLASSVGVASESHNADQDRSQENSHSSPAVVQESVLRCAVG